jgi:diguanylate cyclase (GGDEF)-like protein
LIRVAKTHGPDAGPRQAPSPPAPRADTPQLQRLKRNGVWVAAVALLMLGGPLASVLGARAVARSDAAKARLAFHLASDEVASTLKLAIQHEEDLVVNASAFVRGNPHASAAAFDRWAESANVIQRYPELQDFGLVTLVPTSRLAAFESRIAANPIRPLGPHSVGPKESFQVLPPGKRPYYCLAVAGLARSAATFVPGGMDYCALAPTLITARASGLTGYAPFTDGNPTALGVETPVYRGRRAPATAAARKHAFVGWLGELIEPDVVLTSALAGHPSLAVSLRYDSPFSHVAFTRGTTPAHAQSAETDLQVGKVAGLPGAHEGWTVQTFEAGAAGGLFSRWDSLTLLSSGTLLSMAIALLVVLLSTGRMRALALVREKTRELSEKNRELSHQAMHDALTGLPNRALVLDRAEQLLARVARQPGMMAGALFIDLDGFKHVNDNFGHAAGDQLLSDMARRLQAAAREQDTVGRLGGDEFVVLVESAADEATFDLLADRLAKLLREPFELADGRKIFSVTASIGVAVGRYTSPDALLRDADLALYSAKAAGKDRYALFEASMHADGRLELESDLSAALADGQFFLLYQPIFHLSSREVVSLEALIRWRHPQRGVVDPGDFIPLAEESGLILHIGRWVLDEACRQAATWAASGHSISVSVNVSAQQLGRAEFAEDVKRALQASGLDPSSLTLEITETTLMRDVPAACEHLKAIKALGVRIALDDFGTGYAWLSTLQRVPVDVLKIDMSFVAALNDGDRGRELFQAILRVGQTLSLAVVAEGIEEQRQLDALEAMACEMGQGFLLGKPDAAEAIAGLLNPDTAANAVGSSV